MWAGLVRLTRSVALVAWVVLVVGFGPSAAWAAGDGSPSTSDPAPTSSDGSVSSSSPPSPTDPPDTSSSTSEPAPSSQPWPTGDTGAVLVELDPAQFSQLQDLLSTEPQDVATGTAGVVVIDSDQWSTMTDHLSAYLIGAALLVLVGFAGTISTWGRSR